MPAPHDIEAAFVRKVLATGVVGEALPHEPQRASRRPPAVTMLLAQTQPVTDHLGVIELRWRWSVYVIFQLKDWVEAQEQLKRVIPPLVTLITPLSAPEFRTLDGTCDEALLSDEGDEPDFQPEDEQLVKRLVLTAVTTSAA